MRLVQNSSSNYANQGSENITPFYRGKMFALEPKYLTQYFKERPFIGKKYLGSNIPSRLCPGACMGGVFVVDNHPRKPVKSPSGLIHFVTCSTNNDKRIHQNNMSLPSQSTRVGSTHSLCVHRFSGRGLYWIYN